MKKLLFISILFFTIISNAQEKITKNLGDFSILKVYNGIEVELIKSDKNSLEITGEKASKVRIKTVDNTLKILLKFPEISADNKVLVKLFYKNPLTIIDGNEGATITGKDFKQEKIIIKAQERAFINIVVNADKIDVKAISGGIIKLSGTAKTVKVATDLYGIFHGFTLKVADLATVQAGTGAKAEIFVEKTLHASVNFGGSIFYKGNPKLITDKKVAGGIIKQRK